MKSMEEYMGLKIGDVVQLKSGGPDMTITSITKWGDEDTGIEAHCEWFFVKTNINEMVRKEGNFHPATLKVVAMND